MAFQAMARCNKCGSGLAPRSAARAALDLKGAEDPKASASRCAARAALDLKGAEDPKASAPRAALDLSGAENPTTTTHTVIVSLKRGKKRSRRQAQARRPLPREVFWDQQRVTEEAGATLRRPAIKT